MSTERNHLERPDLEESVLGTIIVYHKAAGIALQSLQSTWDEAWTSQERREIAAIVRRLHNEGRPCDLVTVEHVITQTAGSDGALQTLRQIQAASESADVLHERATELHSITLQRLATRSAETFAATMRLAPADDISAAVANHCEAMSLAAAGQMQQEDMQMLVDKVIARYYEAKAGKYISGVLTGLPNYDRVSGGVPYGTTTVLGGRPSHGKSALAGWIAQNAASEIWREDKKGKKTLEKPAVPVIIFTHEPTGMQITTRMACQHARTALVHTRSGTYNVETEKRFLNALKHIHSLPIIVYDIPGASPLACRAALQYAMRHTFHGVKPLVIVDYMQLEHLPNFHGNDQEEVTRISQIWLDTFRMTGAAGLLLSQLNREADGRAPKLADLRQSGAIEQDAYGVLFTYRPGHSNPKKPANILEVACAKNRDGDLSYDYLHFAGYCIGIEPWKEGIHKELTREQQSETEKKPVREQARRNAQYREFKDEELT